VVRIRRADRIHPDVEIARVVARTGLVPWITVPAAVVLVAYFLSGKDTSVDVDLNLRANVSLALALTVVAPAVLIKLYMDRREIGRQRGRLTLLEGRVTELTEKNQTLSMEKAELEGRLDELRGMNNQG
jgi:hypothetical protein